LKDKCYEGSNSFGAFHLYSVEHEGLEKAFFAPAEVHEQIVGSNLKAAMSSWFGRLLRKTERRSALE